MRKIITILPAAKTTKTQSAAKTYGQEVYVLLNRIYSINGLLVKKYCKKVR